MEQSSRQRILPPETANSVIHRFSINGHQYIVMLDKYPEGHPAALHITPYEEGGLRGLLDGLSRTASLALQYGVPLEDLIKEWKGSRSEPSGLTDNVQIPHAKSLLDYVARWMELRFLPQEGEAPRP